MKFAVPSIISLLVSELYNIIDTFFLGRYVGSYAIGALSIAFPIQRLLSSIALLISVGTSTAVSRYLGEKNYRNVGIYISTAIITTIGAMSLITAAIYVNSPWIIKKLGASMAIYPLAYKYISIVIFGGIMQGLTLAMCFIMNAMGNTRITLYSNVIGALLNFIIDFIFVKNMSMGVEGAAWATVISQIIAFIFSVLHFIKVKDIIYIHFAKIKFCILKDIFAVGFSTFVIEISDAVVVVILNNVLYAHGGDESIIIFGVITKISMFMYITMLGIAAAMQPIVAFNYGSRNFRAMKETVKISIKYAFISSMFLWLIMMIFTKSILGSFLIEKSIINEAVKAFRICIAVFPAIGLYYIAIYYYQAIGEAKMSFMLSLYRQLIIFIPLSLVFASLWMVQGVWLSYPVTDVISAITGTVYIRKAHESIGKGTVSYEKTEETVVI